MIGPGDRVPQATVWTAPHERHTMHEVLAEGRVLVLFYLFDWSST